MSNSWFSPTINYTGTGTLHLKSPRGTVWGDAEYRFNEAGRQTLRLDVSEAESDDVEGPLALDALIHGVHPQQSGGKTQLTTSGSFAECIKFELSTRQGRLLANNIGIRQASLNLFGAGEAKLQLSLRGRATYQSIRHGEPKFLVLPLFNFTAALPYGFELNAEHPLRLLRPKDAKTVVRSTPLLQVRVRGQTSFIQPLLDKDERVSQLRRYETPARITDLWVVELPDGWDGDPVDWFPLHLIDLLTLGSGSEVQTPWIEVRDENGRLSRRTHTPFSPACYDDGHVAIDRVCVGGWQTLLERGASSHTWPNVHLRIAASCLCEAGARRGQTLEDRITWACRGLDALCAYSGVTEWDLRNDLPEKTREEIEELRREAVRKVKSLQEQAATVEEHRALGQLEGKLGALTQKRAKFGHKVRTVAGREGLCDPPIVDRFLANAPSWEASGWDELLSFYRGESIHGGYFDVGGRDPDSVQLLRFSCHLQDLGLRILLSIIGYRGPRDPIAVVDTVDEPEPITPRWKLALPRIDRRAVEYQSPVIPAGKGRLRSPRSIDWVTSATSAFELGYQ